MSKKGKSYEFEIKDWVNPEIPETYEKLERGAQQAKRKIESGVTQKQARVKAYRKEASRLASMANKRLARLEKAGLKDSPAYKKWVEDGAVKFGVRGKTHNQLQQEISRLNRFINAQTSTVRGVNSQLKEMAKNTGIKYSNLQDLRKSASKFFELASKVEQYLRTVDDMASAIGYQKIWTAINKYVTDEKINLASSKSDIDSMIDRVASALKEFDKEEHFRVQNGAGWFRLPKD